MRFGALFGWGIVIYAITSLASSGMVMYGFTQGLLPHAIELVVLFLVCFTAGSSLKFRRAADILPYSIAWAIIFLLLEGFFFLPFFGWQLYAGSMLWTDFLLIVAFPLFATASSRQRFPKKQAWET